MHIAVVAPSNTVSPQVPQRVQALITAQYGSEAPKVFFHSQCFLSDGHFAGSDTARENALVEVANDPLYDAVWLGRGGYGANRIAERAIGRMSKAARNKVFLGYSDGGFILAGLLAKQIGHPVHAPMPSDILRDGGEAAVLRSLDWLMAHEAAPTVMPAAPPRLQVAFNLTVLSNLLGTPLEPDLTGRVLMLEEVDEPLYHIDRMFFHITSSANVQQCAGLMLGRCAPVTPNKPDFGLDEVAVAQQWCNRCGIPWLGRADIGHDSDNQVVPFG